MIKKSLVLICLSITLITNILGKHFVDIALDPEQAEICTKLQNTQISQNCRIECYGEDDSLDIIHMRLIFVSEDITKPDRKRAIRQLQSQLDRNFNVSRSQVYGPLKRCKRVFNNYWQMVPPNMWLRPPKTQMIYQIPNSHYIKAHEDRRSSFDDPFFHMEWYCNGVESNGMNLIKAWNMGYSGKGVSICILDDGLDYRHPDISRRYRSDISHDFNDLSDVFKDPLPSSFDGENSHGTKCAGVAAAEANNGVCGVGAAFNAYIGAHRVLDGVITALTEGRSLAYRNYITDIKSMSWGPTDDGRTMEKPNIFSLRALENGVTTGRKNKGTLFVWASGNGGKFGDHCGADAYVSNHNVIAIGSINKYGTLPFFTEYCPAVLAVAYTGGSLLNDSRETMINSGCITTDVLGKCCNDFVGTSAAAPLASGIFALVLEANPSLTYRDVMHLITQTARIPGGKADQSWNMNGAGYLVSEKYGFGVLDAARMIQTARSWVNVGPRFQCEVPTIQFDNVKGRIASGGVFTASIGVASCSNVEALEHVVIYLTMSYEYRGDIRVKLISPSGTSSTLLEYRPLDDSNEGIKHFPLMTTHCWGESPIGIWTIRIEARENFAQFHQGTINRIGMRLFGTRKWPMSRYFQRADISQ